MDRSWNRIFGWAFGVVYIVVGLVGFLVTRNVGFTATQGKLLVVFAINPLHNLVHIAVGALLVIGATSGVQGARLVNGIVGAVYLLVGIVGIFLVNSSANIIALNHPDNILHLVTAVIALGIALRGDSFEPSKAM